MVTDALEMGGIAKGFSAGEACVRALEAGADTLLMPADPDAAIRAVARRRAERPASRAQRVQESVAKILAAKEKVGLDRKRFVDVEAHRRRGRLAGGQRESAGESPTAP